MIGAEDVEPTKTADEMGTEEAPTKMEEVMVTGAESKKTVDGMGTE